MSPDDELGLELIRHARLLQVMRGQLASDVPAGLDYSAIALLMTLVRCGAKRQGELAEAALLDPSTVSRHVGQLVRAGLVERRPHPQDGRAVELAGTPAGQDLAGRLSARRRQVLATVVSQWSKPDVEQLIILLRRLNDDLERLRTQPATPAAPDAPVPDAARQP